MKRPGIPPISGQLTFQEFLPFGQLTLHHLVGVLRLGKIAAPDIPDIRGECLDGLIRDGSVDEVMAVADRYESRYRVGI